MRLKLSNGFVRVTEGDIGAQFSENVRFTIDSDMDGYVPSLLVKFQNENGDVVEALCQKDGDAFVIPSAAYRQTQVIMLTVSSAKGDEVVNSQPLYVRITEGNSGGAIILPTDEDTWKTAVKAYVDSLMAATNEKISQLEQAILGVDELLGTGELDV